MDKLTQAQIKALLNDQRFDGITKAYEEYCNEVRKENVIGNNEFETLRNAFTKEGKLQGIKEFFDKLEQQA